MRFLFLVIALVSLFAAAPSQVYGQQYHYEYEIVDDFDIMAGAASNEALLSGSYGSTNMLQSGMELQSGFEQGLGWSQAEALSSGAEFQNPQQLQSAGLGNWQQSSNWQQSGLDNLRMGSSASWSSKGGQQPILQNLPDVNLGTTVDNRMASPIDLQPILANPTTQTLPTITRSKQAQTLGAVYTSPIVRNQVLHQNVIQPVVMNQPVIRKRYLNQPIVSTRQKTQEIIQPVVTQPIIRRHLIQQPIIRQNVVEQTIVQPHVSEQPFIQRRLVQVPQTNQAIVQKEKEAPAQPVIVHSSSTLPTRMMPETFTYNQAMEQPLQRMTMPEQFQQPIQSKK